MLALQVALFERVLRPIWVSVTAVKPKPRCPKPQYGQVTPDPPSFIFYTCSAVTMLSGVLRQVCPQNTDLLCFATHRSAFLAGPSSLPSSLPSPWEGTQEWMGGYWGIQAEGGRVCEAKASLGIGRQEWPVDPSDLRQVHRWSSHAFTL
jgi:hypothetical protein